MSKRLADLIAMSKRLADLKKQDRPISIYLPEKGSPKLVVTRDGNTKLIKISWKVAEELIAAGFAYGN